jgi:enoyl-CoA hydratase
MEAIYPQRCLRVRARLRRMRPSATPSLLGAALRIDAARIAGGSMGYENIQVEKRGRVALVTLNRPKALNALNSALIAELNDALAQFQSDDKIGCVVLTGSEKAFAAGADIKEMSSLSYVEAYTGDFITSWDEVSRFRKPIIAAVAGYALGGGCELAMMCDFILAADTAKFGQPEITLGVMPGAGGTQRLTRFVGKSKAMEMCLTGRMMDAAEAESSGLVSRVIPADELVDEAMRVAEKIADFSLPIAMMTKESVNRSYETTLTEGVRFERRVFHSMFATEDQSEGMAAFVEKRSPQFKNR